MTDAFMVGLVQSGLVTGNGLSSGTVLKRMPMSFITLMLAPGSHFAWCAMLGAAGGAGVT
jgi:hypothetical protein